MIAVDDLIQAIVWLVEDQPVTLQLNSAGEYDVVKYIGLTPDGVNTFTLLRDELARYGIIVTTDPQALVKYVGET